MAAIMPIPPVTRLVEMTDRDLTQYADLIYQRTGIRVASHKKTLLSNRVRRRLRETGIAGFAEYYQHLRRLPALDPEWDAFLQEITTHETFLFRDRSQWDWFRNVYLPERAATARAGSSGRTLRIWSAACSTGDEPYTVASCVAACLPSYQQWKIQIVGTDIGAGAVEQARAAVFGERAMRLVPDEYKKRFFSHLPETQQWQARPVLTDMIRFKQHNLLQRLGEPPFDVVFLKNVLIYFDGDSKTQALTHLRAQIRPGGLLVSGPAEGISELVKDFTRLQPWLHQRP